MAEIRDSRSEEDKQRTIGFVVGTDSFMSGWGKAPGRSLFAVPFATESDGVLVRANMTDRTEMKRIRVVGAGWKPRLAQGDHLSICALPVRGGKNGHWLTDCAFRGRN